METFKVVKSGTVYKFHKGLVRRGELWKKCNATLVETENDGVLKLENESEKPLSVSMQQCSRVLEAGVRNSRDNVVELLLQKKIIQLGFDSREDAVEWVTVLSSYSKDSLSRRRSSAKHVNNLKSGSSKDMEYNIAYELDSTIPPLDVTVRTSPLAEQLNLRGKFHLLINDDKLTIYSAENKTISFSWEYKTIRKYGRDKKSFSMEVGRRSPTGPGVLVFNTIYGNDIFHRVQKNTLAINSLPAAAPPSAAAAQPPSRVADPPMAAKARNSRDARRHGADGPKAESHPRLGKPSLAPLDSEYSTIEDARARMAKLPSKKLPTAEQEYCKADELKDDAWKTHGRIEENIHTEVYIGMDTPSRAGSKVPPAGAKSQSEDQIYGQINKNKRRDRAEQSTVGDHHSRQEAPGMYSVLEHGARGHRVRPPPEPPSRPMEGEYDHLARPVSSPTRLPPANKGSEYDHLQRDVPASEAQPKKGAGEELYNVIEQPASPFRGQMFDLIDDGSGYMTNAAPQPSVPVEHEYDMATLHGFS